MGGGYGLSQISDTDRPSPSPSQPEKITNDEPTSVSILLVEDNAADVHLVRESLALHKIRNELAVLSDGATAVQYLDAVDSSAVTCPQLVILDLNLPKTTGREVLKRIRQSPRCAKIPVVILSSSGAQKDRDDAHTLGATHYIKKPSDLKEFLEVGAVFKALLDKASDQST